MKLAPPESDPDYWFVNSNDKGEGVGITELFAEKDVEGEANFLLDECLPAAQPPQSAG